MGTDAWARIAGHSSRSAGETAVLVSRHASARSSPQMSRSWRRSPSATSRHFGRCRDMARMLVLGQDLGERPRRGRRTRRLVGRHLIVERFVWPLVVEARPKHLPLPLLGGDGDAPRAHPFELQREMDTTTIGWFEVFGARIGHGITPAPPRARTGRARSGRHIREQPALVPARRR